MFFFIYYNVVQILPEPILFFFKKKDMKGWSSSEMKNWSGEDSAIVGNANEDVGGNQFLCYCVKVNDFYVRLDVRLDSSERNAGIHFRSAKVDE